MRKNIIIIFSIILSIGFSQKSIVQQFSKTFADVAEKVNPAVVTISTDKVIKMDRFNGIEVQNNNRNIERELLVQA